MQGLKLIIFLLISQFFMVRFATKIEDVSLQTDTFIFISYFIAMVSSFGWFLSVGYDKLKLKSLILLETLWILSEIISFSLSLFSIHEFIVPTKSLLFSCWVLFIFYRISKTKSQKINNKDIFAVRTIPDDFQGLILSMIGFYPLGSYGVIYKDDYYHYHHGKFVKSNKRTVTSNKKKFVVMKSGKFDQKVIDELESLVGSDWSYRNNCYTHIRPLLKNQ